MKNALNRNLGMLVGAATLVALVSAGLVACGDSEEATPATTSDAGVSADSGTSTSEEDSSVTTLEDSSTGSDASVSDSGKVEAKPIVVPVSANGHDRFYAITYDAAGNLFAAGTRTETTDAAETVVAIVAKFTGAGVLDSTFGTGGIAPVSLVLPPGNAQVMRGIVVQSTGKIVVATHVTSATGTEPGDRDVAVARLSANGALDTGFGVNGIRNLNLSDPAAATTVFDAHYGLALAPSDKIVIEAVQKADGRNDTDWAIVRLDADGAVDTTFAAGTANRFVLDIATRNANARNVTVLSDGSIVGSGYYETAETTPVTRPVLFKVLANGTADTSFGTNGVYEEEVLPLVTEAYGAKLQGTSFITAGYGRASTGESIDPISLRISATGVRDLTYGTSGVARVDVNGQPDRGRNLVVLPDNRILIVGAGSTSATTTDAMVWMLTANGQPDTTWGPKGYKLYDFGGPADHFWGATLSPDGKTVAVAGIATATGADDDATIFLLPIGP